MKQQEISKLSVEDLKKRLEAATDSITKMKIGHAVTPVENPIQIRDTRKMVARLHTELTKREKSAAADL